MSNLNQTPEGKTAEEIQNFIQPILEKKGNENNTIDLDAYALGLIDSYKLSHQSNRELLEALEENIKDQQELNRVFTNWAKNSTGDKADFYDRMAKIAQDRMDKNNSLIQKHKEG